VKHSFIVLMLLLSVPVFFGCSQLGRSHSDAVTSATPKYDKSKPIILPPENESYVVLGKMDGLKNFVVKYDAQLYRGGELYSDTGMKSLESLGIQTIVSIIPNDTERALIKKSSMTLVEIPFDKKSGVTQEGLKRYLDLFSGNQTPVYVHCHGGTHRASVLGVAYRVHKCGWSWERAILEHGYLGGSLKDDQIMLQSIRNLAK